MLNFSKINVLIIYLLFFFISVFSFLNFQNKDDQFIKKKINLGLDLQGGSYLLLEINSDSLVKEKIQSKVIPIKKLLKDNEINYDNFKISENYLSLSIDNIEKFVEVLQLWIGEGGSTFRDHNHFKNIDEYTLVGESRDLSGEKKVEVLKTVTGLVVTVLQRKVKPKKFKIF